MVLAELNIRHTRNYMPTRRVALSDTFIPTSGPAYGPALLAAVVSEFAAELDDERRDLVPRLLRDARQGLRTPRIALRYRIQTDTHGLDRSRHRIIGSTVNSLDGIGVPAIILELDLHGRAVPQILGAVLAASSLPESARDIALNAIESAWLTPQIPAGFVVRRLIEGAPDLREFIAPGIAPPKDWAGVPADRRWAMEVLGLTPNEPLVRREVQLRFRRLVRVAHPDHGAGSSGAAERLAELSDARRVLLTVCDLLDIDDLEPESAPSAPTG